MPDEEIQNQIDALRGELSSVILAIAEIKKHDHFFIGEKLFLKHHHNFGYHNISVTIPSGDATIATRYDRFFTADYDLEIISAEEVHQVAAGAADTLDVYKLTSGQATSAGVSVLSGTFTLNSTANTPVRKSSISTKANRILKRGDGLALITSGTLASLNHLSISVYYLPLGITPTNS